MGNSISNLFNDMFGKPEVRLLTLGLNAAGKATILYKLKLGNIFPTWPTIGLNVETVEYKYIKFIMWDVGGRKKFRALWRHYFKNTQGLIFVVDSNDKLRIDDARKELQNLLREDELRNAVLLVLANKQDLPNAMSLSEITEGLGLNNYKQLMWHIQATCAMNDGGLYEGLYSLSGAIERNQLMS